MIRPLSLFIGLRYTRAKRRNRFISFISLASILGIALGVTVLITVLSVMNGFDYQIRTRFFSMVPQVTVFTNESLRDAWQPLQKALSGVSAVKAMAPYVSGNGILVRGNQVTGLQIMGIDPQREVKISAIGDKMVSGQLSDLKPGQFNVVIGQDLAVRLGVKVGDKINLFTPHATVTLMGTFPRVKRLNVIGIFHTSSGFGFDNTVAFVSLGDAEKLFPVSEGARGFHLKLDDIYAAGSVTRTLQSMLPPQFQLTNWMMQFGAFFSALAMEKTMLFIILLLIVAVAAFNLVSTLVMVVNDKRADIAILRTLGATPGMILRTILVTGCMIGLLGTLLGLLGGLLLASHVTQITDTLQRFFGVQFVDASVYFIDYLPSRIEPWDVFHVCLIALGLSVVATLYPAWIAFRTQPAEALRYD